VHGLDIAPDGANPDEAIIGSAEGRGSLSVCLDKDMSIYEWVS
jgi:hypothetical protein